jgi:hypothetical protein
MHFKNKIQKNWKSFELECDLNSDTEKRKNKLKNGKFICINKGEKETKVLL